MIYDDLAVRKRYSDWLIVTKLQKLQLINQGNPELEKIKTGNNSKTTEKLTHVLKEVSEVPLLP